MRLATYTAGSLVAAGIGAAVASAFFFFEFAIIATLVVIVIALGPIVSVGAKKDKVVQKTTYQLDEGFAYISRGRTSDDPGTLNLDGVLRLHKSKPAPLTPPDLGGFTIAFPVTKTNSAETKGSLKARNADFVDFRAGIQNLLNLTVNLDSAKAKARNEFIGGRITMSDTKQSGSVKVDKTFTKLSGKVNLKGKGTVSGGPNDGYDVKYKIKVKFKPRKAEF